MTNGKGYDYEWLAKCDYPVGTDGPDMDAPCREPAIVRVWWSDYDTDYMFLCPEHWETVKKEEER
jgi:hypothetical protein